MLKCAFGREHTPGLSVLTEPSFHTVTMRRPTRYLRFRGSSRLLKNGFDAWHGATLIRERDATRTIDSISSVPGFDSCSSPYLFRVFQQPARAEEQMIH